MQFFDALVVQAIFKIILSQVPSSSYHILIRFGFHWLQLAYRMCFRSRELRSCRRYGFRRRKEIGATRNGGDQKDQARREESPFCMVPSKESNGLTGTDSIFFAGTLIRHIN